jgi:drug/metabolite transporter (DMT)-like permease
VLGRRLVRLDPAAHAGDLLVSTGWQMVFGGGVLVVAGAAAGEVGRLDVGGLSAGSVWAFVYLIVVGSLLAFTAYAWLLRNAPISLVATYAYVNPVVAIALGAAILDEHLTVTTGIGAAVVVASVAVVVRGPAHRAGARTRRAGGPHRPLP